MKELTLEELKSESLILLKEFHNFCMEHDIKYSIAYGTLIGAVRHKGFIPWDEDVDVLMTRENYDKFLKLYTSDKYAIINRQTNPKCWILFSRLCEVKRTICRTSTAWLGDNTEAGVWIDIFPIDVAPSDPTDYQGLSKLLQHIYKHGVKIRKVHSPILKGMPLRMLLKILFKKKVHPTLLYKNSPEDFLDFQDRLIRYAHEDNSDYVSQLCVPELNGYFHKSEIEEYVYLDFEDTKFMAFKNYDSILRNIYGDYMQLPPLEMRKSQRSFIRFYWK